MKKSPLLFLALMALATTASAQYKIDALIPPSGSFTPTAIKNGVVVGNVDDDSGRTPTTWTMSGPSSLTGPAGYGFLVANSVNRLGDVVGTGGGGRTPPGAIVWHNGVASVLPTEDNDDDTTEFLYGSRATGINDHGVIIGNATTQYGENNGVIWNGDQIQLLLGLDPIDEFQTSSALGINNSGLVVGSAVGGGKLYATSWVNGQATIMDASLGRSVANAVNDSGVAVGYGTGADDNPFAFMHGASGTTILPTLTGFIGAEASSINETGLAVGSCFPDGTGEGVATLWKNGAAYDLNSLLGASAPDWNLTSATAIDDDGTIVGFGYYKGEYASFRAAPVPEPASLLALAGGAAVLLRRRRK